MGMEGLFRAKGPASDYGASLTSSVIVTCVMAASSSLIFGYDNGIFGGISSMDSFLSKFFPGVQRKKLARERSNAYCVYNNESLTAFTSSLYIAGLLASLLAGKVSKAIGRQAIMLLGGAMFFAGAAVNAGAANIAMLIVGRMLLGFGVGFTNQATPVYLAQVAPPQWRGACMSGFQLFIALGILIANLTNYGTNHINHWGWRLSLGLAAVPASVIVLCALFFITDSPSRLVVRGKLDAAGAALHRIRGPNANIDAELKDVIRSVEESTKNEEEAYRRILWREYQPHLAMAVAVPLFFQLTGIIVLVFFSPLIFRTVGFGSNAALMGAVILGVVKLGSNLLFLLIIDRLGRRRLFFIGGFVMVVCQVAVACIMGLKIGRNGKRVMSHGYAIAVLVLSCGHTAGFGVSWGPLNWVIQGEIFPVEIRSAGVGIRNAISLGVTFLQAQTFLAMLCTFKYATFAYYAVWIVVMTTFIALFLPETKGVPLESMNVVWARHWYWRRFVKERNHVINEST